MHRLGRAYPRRLPGPGPRRSAAGVPLHAPRLSTPTTARSSSTARSRRCSRRCTSTHSPSPAPVAAPTTPWSRARTARSSASSSVTATSPAAVPRRSTPSPSRSSRPYLNFHRPCFFPTEEVDRKGRVRKRYRDADIMTPYEKLKSLPDAAACPEARNHLRKARRGRVRDERQRSRAGARRGPHAVVPVHPPSGLKVCSGPLPPPVGRRRAVDEQARGSSNTGRANSRGRCRARIAGADSRPSPAAVEYGRTAMSSSPDRRRRLASSPASAPPKGGSATPSGTSADDDPSSRCRPFHSPSRSHVQPLCCRFRARLPHSANVHRRTFAPLGLLLFRTRQTRPSPFGCYGSGYSTFALNQDAPSAASYIVTVLPP